LYNVWLNLACWFWRRRFLKTFSVYFYSFATISPLEKGYPLRLNNFKSPTPKDNLVKIGSVVLEKRILKWPHPIFFIFVIISPLKKTWPFIWTKLNPLHPRIICTKFD
jgi:hypothetical protein